MFSPHLANIKLNFRSFPPYLSDSVSFPLIPSDAAREGEDVFARYMVDAGGVQKINCALGITGACLFRALPFIIKDREGWQQRFTASCGLIFGHVPLSAALSSDWPIFHLWNLVSSLRREGMGKGFRSILTEKDLQPFKGNYIPGVSIEILLARRYLKQSILARDVYDIPDYPKYHCSPFFN
jgi:hypothetical protein